jgi:23S rRNA pseudoU1915 N3-methylase RlmH
MQQIIEWLLAGRAEMAARLKAKMDANLAEMKAERKANQATMELLQQDKQAMREDIKSGQAEMGST